MSGAAFWSLCPLRWELMVTDPASPLDILISVMRTHFENQDYDAAVALAKAAAPYVHPKPAAGTGTGRIDTLRDEQLVELCRPRMARAGAAQEAPAESGSVVPFRPV
jgi:hypothetical protein